MRAIKGRGAGVTLRQAVVAGIAALTIGPAHAAAPMLDSYRARLSPADHYNSRGERLTAPAAILRQDRANFHRFGIRDAEDEDDGYFADAGNRTLMERLLDRGPVTGAARRAITDGTPMVLVQIYRTEAGDAVRVTVLTEP